MTDTDPILAAQTVPQFLEAVNQKYQLTLPTDFSDGSSISQLLKQPIAVSHENEEAVAYTARGSPLDFPPFNFGIELKEPYTLKAIVIITVSKDLN